MFALVLGQLSADYFISLITQGFGLGGIIGAIMGSIAWTINEKGNRAIGSLVAGGVLGLFAGLFLVGGQLLTRFNSAEAIFMNADQASGETIFAILGVLWFTLVGAAIGGAIVSLGRALYGVLAGLLAGTVAGMILVLLNLELGLRATGPVATLLVGATTLILLVIMVSGQDK